MAVYLLLFLLSFDKIDFGRSGIFFFMFLEGWEFGVAYSMILLLSLKAF